MEQPNKNEQSESYPDKKQKWTKGHVIQVIFLILLFGAICALIMAIVTVKKYEVMLARPLEYNLDKFGLQACSCINNQNKIVPITALGSNKSFLELFPSLAPQSRPLFVSGGLNLTAP